MSPLLLLLLLLVALVMAIVSVGGEGASAAVTSQQVLSGDGGDASASDYDEEQRAHGPMEGGGPENEKTFDPHTTTDRMGSLEEGASKRVKRYEG